MMATLSTYAQQGRQLLRTYLADRRVFTAMHAVGYGLGGLLLSAASLGNAAQPLVLGLICALSGWQAVFLGTGAMVGYPLFWGSVGIQGVVWTCCGILAVLTMGRTIRKESPYLLPALAALTVAAVGLGFQIWFSDETSVGIYLLRILLAAGSAGVFRLALEDRDPVARWISWSLGILALAQVAPFRWLCLGFAGAGVISMVCPFPAAALAGLALDLARVTPVPMTAVVCVAYLVRLIPWGRSRAVYLAPAPVYLLVMYLCGKWDLYPLLPLAVGGVLGMWIPGQAKVGHRRGSSGIAQVRLEMVSGVFSQMQQLLLESAAPPIDEGALMARGAERACGSCPNRKGCRERESAAALPPLLLHRPLLDSTDLPVVCKKPGRLLTELRRVQEQLRAIRADRERQKEYRSAVLQQYQFLSAYLQDLSDDLSRRGISPHPRFKPEVSVSANRPREENGDRCQWFAGVGCKYYVVLCDGMGTGSGAVDEGETALKMLRRLLTAGYPAEYALRSLNSLCALRGRAGSVTVDLAELQLDTGKAALYKWGAAPSYLITPGGAEKIGTATVPPGLSVTESRETAERLSLRRGEVLLLLSDGVGGEDALRCCVYTPGEPPGELATRVLESGNVNAADDATVAAIRLSSVSLTA